MPSTTLRLAVLNIGMELPYLLLSLCRFNRGLLSRRESASERDFALLRTAVLPLPVIFRGSEIHATACLGIWSSNGGSNSVADVLV